MAPSKRVPKPKRPSAAPTAVPNAQRADQGPLLEDLDGLVAVRKCAKAFLGAATISVKNVEFKWSRSE